MMKPLVPNLWSVATRQGWSFQLTIPLVDLASILDLHRVHNLPLKVKEGYSVTADIATDYLVTDYTRTYFLELNKEDFQVTPL
jgi:hypothetical protein